MPRKTYAKQRKHQNPVEQQRLIDKLLRTHTLPEVVSSKAGILLAQARELTRRAKNPRIGAG